MDMWCYERVGVAETMVVRLDEGVVVRFVVVVVDKGVVVVMMVMGVGAFVPHTA